MKIISKRGRISPQTQQPLSLTHDQCQEMITCATDPLYFIRKYVQVPASNSSGTTRIVLQNHHIDFIIMSKVSKGLIGMMPRQSGMTTMSLALVLWETLFKSDYRTAIFGNGFESTKDLYNILTHMLFHLPSFLRPNIKTNRRSLIEFTNGSSFIIETLSHTVLRGRALSRIYVDSFAFAPEKLQQTIYNDIGSLLLLNGKVLIASTPNGKHNTFAAAWAHAFTPSAHFTPFKRTADDIAYPHSWKQKTAAVLGHDMWQQNYMCEFV